MAITKIIRPLPDAPDSVNDSAPAFNTKANAYVSAQKNQFQPDVNAWATEANALEGDMTALKDLCEGAVATIPAGTINDAGTALDMVWSSSKVDGLTKQAKTYRNIANNLGGVYTNNLPYHTTQMIGVTSTTVAEIFTIEISGAGNHIMSNTSGGASTAYMFCTFVVPAGATYSITASSSGQIRSWTELT